MNASLDEFADLLAERVAERLAPRVAELLREDLRAQDDDELASPGEIALRLGRSVDWVRDHADELGVIRVGDGPKARLWFKPGVVDERLEARAA